MVPSLSNEDDHFLVSAESVDVTDEPYAGS